MAHGVLILPKGTTGRLLLEGLATYDMDTGALTYLDDTASVEVTRVYDEASGEDIDGETWPLACTYLTDSTGDFHAPLRSSLVVTELQRLIATVTIDAGTDQDRVMQLRLLVEEDRGD